MSKRSRHEAAGYGGFCPHGKGCNVPYLSCPALADIDSTHHECGVYKSRHLLATAAELVDEAPDNGDKSNITPQIIEERQEGLQLREMTRREKTDLYIATSVIRMEANAAAKKPIDNGCRTNRYIERLNKLENECTRIMRDLENEGISVDDPDHQILETSEYRLHHEPQETAFAGE